MAADGAWPERELDAAAPRRAAAELRGVLVDLEGRLTTPMRPHAAAALAEALQILARRLARHEAAAAEHRAALAAQIVQSETRLDRRLEKMLADMAAVRAAPAAAEPEPRLIRMILSAASLAAALAVLGAGAVILARPEALPQAIATPVARLDLRPSLKAERAPLAAAAARASLPSAPPLPAPASSDSFEAVATALARGEATALPRLTGLAQAGDARAQLQLASLYEAGTAGVPRDLAAARAWTRKAAEGGDRIGMHNLGLFLSAGEGGLRDDAEAAAWFRRAADRGVVDSQYNLGLLYEAGRGVEKNRREAYRWFAVAANAGDVAAREKQVELEARLTPAERGGLDRDAAGYQPGAAALGDTTIVIPPAQSLAETQALLARKGYYVGPVDGISSATFRAAASTYLRDHPQPRTP
jgi:localization factor PodJL